MMVCLVTMFAVLLLLLLLLALLFFVGIKTLLSPLGIFLQVFDSISVVNLLSEKQLINSKLT